MDVQGIEKPKFYLEKAHATLTTVVDQSNELGKLYGFKAVPNVYLIGSNGNVDYIELGTFNIRDSAKRSLVKNWASGKEYQNFFTKLPVINVSPCNQGAMRCQSNANYHTENGALLPAS